MSLKPQSDQPCRSDEDVSHLIEAARKGDHSQIGVLWKIYRNYLLKIAGASLAKDVSVKIAPSDLVQETFLQASASFAEFRGTTELELRGWLAQIVRRKAFDANRHFHDYEKRDIAREVPLATDSSSANELVHFVSNEPPPSQNALAAENLRILRDGLEKLNEDQRQAIVLHNFEHVDFQEIGNRLGRSKEAARKLWARAVEKLAAELHFYDSSSD